MESLSDRYFFFNPEDLTRFFIVEFIYKFKKNITEKLKKFPG